MRVPSGEWLLLAKLDELSCDYRVPLELRMRLAYEAARRERLLSGEELAPATPVFTIREADK